MIGDFCQDILAADKYSHAVLGELVVSVSLCIQCCGGLDVDRLFRSSDGMRVLDLIQDNAGKGIVHVSAQLVDVLCRDGLSVNGITRPAC